MASTTRPVSDMLPLIKRANLAPFSKFKSLGGCPILAVLVHACPPQAGKGGSWVFLDVPNSCYPLPLAPRLLPVSS